MVGCLAACALALLAAAGAALACHRRGQAERGFAALGLGAAVIAGLVIRVGLASLDAAFLAPVQELARQAGTTALREGAALALDTGHPRRPSVLFSLPAAWLRAGGPPLWEDGSERGGRRMRLEEFLQRNPRAYVLTQPRRERRLAALPGLQLLEARRGWVLLRTGNAVTLAQRRQ
jgi:hypothetical protein